MHVSLSTADRMTLLSEMSTLFASGIPVMDIVDSLLEDSKGGREIILKTLKKDLNEGKTIAQSFSRFPDAFDPIVVNLLKSAEDSGTLDVALKDIVENIKEEMAFTDKVKTALAYPTTIFVVFTAVILMILIYVIPRVSSVFSKLKVTLPLPTKILIFTSDILLHYTPYVIMGIGMSIFLGVILYRTNKRGFTNFFLSLPFISDLAREIDFTRFSHSMALLLTAGIPIGDALVFTEQIVMKKELVLLIQKTEDSVKNGKKLSDGLKKQSGLVPATMLRIIEAGEKSGSLEKSMRDCSEYFSARVTNTLKTMTTLLEPILLVIVGVLVGGMMLAIIAPIYNLIGQIRS